MLTKPIQEEKSSPVAETSMRRRQFIAFQRISPALDRLSGDSLFSGPRIARNATPKIETSLYRPPRSSRRRECFSPDRGVVRRRAAFPHRAGRARVRRANGDPRSFSIQVPMITIDHQEGYERPLR